MSCAALPSSLSARAVVTSQVVSFGVASGAGYWLAGGNQSANVPGSFWCTALEILFQNVGALVVLALGSLLSFGICGILFFTINGMVFGNMLGVLPTETVAYVALYAPLEIAAFLFVSFAATGAAFSIMHGDDVALSLTAAGRRIGYAGAGLGASACLEAWAISLAW